MGSEPLDCGMRMICLALFNLFSFVGLDTLFFVFCFLLSFAELLQIFCIWIGVIYDFCQTVSQEQNLYPQLRRLGLPKYSRGCYPHRLCRVFLRSNRVPLRSDKVFRASLACSRTSSVFPEMSWYID